MNIRFENVSLTYDNGVEVLHDLNFELPKGKLIALLGPSGGGKSTTLNLISGLLTATTGKISFGDEDVTKKDALARGVGMVFQSYALYPHMTVRDNIAFPMEMAKIDKSTRRKRAEELAKLVRVEDQLDKKPGSLSGGQQQRVGIARALAKNPSILLLDEPLSNLDARLRIEMREEIRRIQKETGVTTVFVTHDQNEAMHIADKIMVLNDGNIQQFDNPQSLYYNPKNKFIAEFIGDPEINMIPAEVLKDKVDFPKGSVQLGIRPEAIIPKSKKGPVLDVIPQDVLAFGRDRQTVFDYKGHQLISTEIIEKKKEVSLDLDYVFAFDKDGNRLYLKGQEESKS